MRIPSVQKKLFPGIPEKDWRGIARYLSFFNPLHDLVQADRFITDDFCTDIDPAPGKVHVRVMPEIVVMVVPVDNPAVK